MQETNTNRLLSIPLLYMGESLQFKNSQPSICPPLSNLGIMKEGQVLDSSNFDHHSPFLPHKTFNPKFNQERPTASSNHSSNYPRIFEVGPIEPNIPHQNPENFPNTPLTFHT